MASVNYHEVLAQIALRVNAIVGTSTSTLNTNYTTRPLTTTQFQSTIFPFAAFLDALQVTEETVAHHIANNRTHPWRAYLISATGDIAHNGNLPSVDTGFKQIIGVWGNVYDGSDSVECTPKSPAYIAKRVKNSNTFFKVAVYHYCIDGDRILHTRTVVKIRVCIYDRATQRTAIAANTAMLLPDAVEGALVCGALAQLVRDDEFTGQASVYAAYFQEYLKQIDTGAVSFSDLPPL